MTLIKIQKNKAFTLIELMVATTLFTIVMMMGVGSLVVSSNFAKEAQKLRIAVDNVNFAMESMTRELRTGTHYNCGGTYTMADDDLVRDCAGESFVAFDPQITTTVKKVAYFRTLRTVAPYANTYTLERCEFTNVINCYDIVSKDVDVQMLKFYVTGSLLADNVQPSVKILMKGVVKVKEGYTPFALQSMSSQRSTEL